MYRQPLHPSSANATSSRPANRASQARRCARSGLESLTIRSVRPIAFQVDGHCLGDTEAAQFQFVPTRFASWADPPITSQRREQNVIDLTSN